MGDIPEVASDAERYQGHSSIISKDERDAIPLQDAALSNEQMKETRAIKDRHHAELIAMDCLQREARRALERQIVQERHAQE